MPFDHTFYLLSKYRQLQHTKQLEHYALTDTASLARYFATHAIDPQAHYLSSGMAEGINPSPAFDTHAYLDAKLAELQNPEKYGDGSASPYAHFTREDVINAFQQRGLTALAHYQQYGVHEGIKPQVPLEATQGEVFQLTPATDTLTGSPLNDTFKAVAAARDSERTLNPNDSIEGGEGHDTLNVTLNSHFAGFSEAGGLSNIEHIVLNNPASLPRTVNTQGVEDAPRYTLNGAVHLQVAAEALHLVQQEKNTLELSQAAVQQLTLSGEGATAISAVADTLTQLDASAHRGGLTLNLQGATAGEVTAVRTGKGDDVMTTHHALAMNALIEGGKGNDQLVLNTGGTQRYTLRSVETLHLENSTGLTFSAQKVEGLQRVVSTEQQSANALLANLGEQPLEIMLRGESAAGAALTALHHGASLLEVNGQRAGESNTTPLTLTASPTVQMAVVNNSVYAGVLTAPRATMLEVLANGEVDLSTANLNAVEQVALNGSGAVTLGALGSATRALWVQAAELSQGLTLGALTGTVVEVDAKSALGSVTYGTLSASERVVLNGTEFAENTATVNGLGQQFTTTLNGGLAADTYTVNLAENTTEVTVSGDLDLGEDTLTLSLADSAQDEISAVYRIAHAEHLVFTFADTNDTVVLSANSTLGDAETLTVTNGTLDVSAMANADEWAGIAHVSVNSGLWLNAAQYEALVASGAMVRSSSGEGRLIVSATTEEQQAQVVEATENLNVQGAISVTLHTAVDNATDQWRMDVTGVAVNEGDFL